MNAPPAVSTGLYRALLVERYDRLPVVLRRFHDLDAASARGTLRITRGPGAIRERLADLLGLPAAGESVAVDLLVRTVDGVQTWIRHYGPLRIETRQWIQAGLLVEAAGPYRMGFRLEADSERLRFVFVRAWIGPVPLPRFLSLQVDATASAAPTAESWRIDVRISAPLLGLLARYEGEVTAEWRLP